MSTQRRFGELLVERGFISGDQLREALRVQPREKKRLGQLLVEMGALSGDQLNWALSELVGVPYVDLTEEMVDLDLVRTMPEEVLRRHQAVPVLRVGTELTVILADPTNRQAVVELEALGGATVRTAMASEQTVTKLLDKAFPRSAHLVDSVRYAEVIAGDGAGEGDVTGVAQVYSLLVGAFREEATEVHLEPQRQDIRVRYRVDGQLVERPRLARAALGPVLFRFRILAGLRGASLPASAHLRTRLEDQDVELDILFYPTLYGEAVTVSLWRRRPQAPALESLELSPAVLDAIPRLLAAEGGLVFVTGWEARARAALLYAMAGAAAGPARKVLTLERAVSYVVPEFVQVEAPEDFARAAATILAQPVDVALVEDVSAQPVCLAAFGSAERGALVLAGLGFATSDTGLGHLLTLDVPRFPLLAQIRGFVDVRQRGARYSADVRLMTDEFRQELMDQQHGHR